MGKKIVVVTGSPRVGGNSDILAESFIRGAHAAGNEIMRFDAGKKKLQGCMDCEACFAHGTPCAFNNDSFNEFANMLQKAEALVFVTPVYWYSWPAQLKAAIDRMFAFYCGGVELPVKEIALIACAEEAEKTAFASLMMNLTQIAGIMKWKIKDSLLVPGVFEAGSVLNTTASADAEKMGREF